MFPTKILDPGPQQVCHCASCVYFKFCKSLSVRTLKRCSIPHTSSQILCNSLLSFNVNRCILYVEWLSEKKRRQLWWNLIVQFDRRHMEWYSWMCTLCVCVCDAMMNVIHHFSSSSFHKGPSWLLVPLSLHLWDRKGWRGHATGNRKWNSVSVCRDSFNTQHQDYMRWVEQQPHFLVHDGFFITTSESVIRQHCAVKHSLSKGACFSVCVHFHEPLIDKVYFSPQNDFS